MQAVILRGEAPKGSGYGYGYGYGSGDGSGYGSGYGYGYGYGSGSGSGYGYGYGSGEYWASTINAFVRKMGDSAIARLDNLRKSGAKIAFWRSDSQGKPSNGGSLSAAYPGRVDEVPGPLRDECGRGQLHATLIPPKWEGSRWWIVALIGEVKGDDEKYWALKREVIGECL